MLCSLGLQSPRLPSREAKGIHLSQGSVLQSIGNYYGMMPIMNEYFLDPELNPSERGVCACVFRSIAETCNMPHGASSA